MPDQQFAPAGEAHRPGQRAEAQRPDRREVVGQQQQRHLQPQQTQQPAQQLPGGRGAARGSSTR
ncbi:hypothetical protein [Saccharopolyspora cebuensis]|uniref:hypothetical protein n=1 Tax=Saccharopolyspora cebuensis TaxID=418759 RepID=UPI0031E9C239